MSTLKLNVTGMTCQHCAMAVTRALKSVAGVESAQVDLEQEEAVVAGNVEVEQLIQAIRNEGYGAELRA